MAGAFGKKGSTSGSRAVHDTLVELDAPMAANFGTGYPIAFSRAAGARVRDVDGNRYIDLSGFFGVAAVGHRNRAVMNAVRVQAGRLPHAMGDVHPADVKARFLRRLRGFMPAPDYKAVLSLNGSDAVESALKFAAASTGRAGVVAFEGSYHGLSGLALEVTAQDTFRRPFAAMLSDRVAFVPFPGRAGVDVASVMDRIRECVIGRHGAEAPVGALIVEPVQGRGGIIVPPTGFLSALSSLCAELEVVLIVDEVFTGTGRTGAFLACDHEGVVPDVVCLGKALGGGIPISACLMRGPAADSVKGAPHVAVHTSTYMGYPLGCAAGLAVLREIEKKALYDNASRIGAGIIARARDWRDRFEAVADVRGLGAMVGLEMAGARGVSGGEMAQLICEEVLQKGVILLTEGEHGEVISFTPPFVISDSDLNRALDIVEEALSACT